jgi:hypothetical protein
MHLDDWMDRFVAIEKVVTMQDVSFDAWSPGGAARFQECIRKPQPFTEQYIHLIHFTDDTVKLYAIRNRAPVSKSPHA